MKILIFGASGATGTHLLQQALQDGHHVTAFVRDRAKLAFSHARLDVIEGDICDVKTISDAVAGQDAVVSALGAHHMFKLDEVVISGISTIVLAMAWAKVDRFIYLSAVGVRETRSNAGLMIRLLAPTILATETEGHERKEKIIINSELNWTIVRAPILTDGPLTRGYRSGRTLFSTVWAAKLSRADVAHFMLSKISDKRSMGRCLSLMPQSREHQKKN